MVLPVIVLGPWLREAAMTLPNLPLAKHLANLEAHIGALGVQNEAFLRDWSRCRDGMSPHLRRVTPWGLSRPIAFTRARVLAHVYISS